LLGLQDVIAGNNSENRDNDQEISALRQIKKSAAVFIIGSDRLAGFGRALPSRTRGNVLVPGRLSSSRQGASKDTSSKSNAPAEGPGHCPVEMALRTRWCVSITI
jgi:hypothetical protein